MKEQWKNIFEAILAGMGFAIGFFLMALIFMLIFSPAEANANYYPVGKEGATTTYMIKADCESQENHKCVDITGKNLAYQEYDKTSKTWSSNTQKKKSFDKKKSDKAAKIQRKKTAKTNRLKALEKCKGASTLPGAKVKVCVEHLVKQILNE